MIHYHSGSLPGGTEAQLAYAGKHAMISFAEGHNLAPMIVELCHSFSLDGDLSNRTDQGSLLANMEEYAAWVERWYRHPALDFYLMPYSCTPEADSLVSDWRELVSDDIYTRGIPVFNLDQSLGHLDDLLEEFPHSLAIATVSSYGDPGSLKWWERIAQVMEKLIDEDGRPIRRLHGVQMLDPTIFSHLPLSSADSNCVARNCGEDHRWEGPYQPATPYQRALILMERIERHASASRWEEHHGERNFDLFG